MIKFKDDVNRPIGHLTLKVYKNDKLIDTIEGNNLIVDEASDLIAECLITNDSNDLLGTFGVGTGSATPAAGDTRATFTNLATKTVATSSYSSGTKQLTFTFTVEASEYNGNTIKEFGLFSDGPGGSERLFARRVISGSIVKVNDTRVEGTWIIQL